MRWIFFILPFFCFSQTIILTDADIKAFPGAIGHGSGATGARGTGNVFFVSSTSDGTGPGTFRKALSDASANGGGYILFRTSGVLTYTGDPDIDDNIYIAGQTAPNGGFGVVAASDDRHQIWIRGSNNIVRHLRFYGGDFQGQDCLTIGSTDAGRITDMNDVIIDHCSFHWAEDENVAFTHYTTAGATVWENPNWFMRNISFTNNIIGEQAGDGNYGMILFGSGKEDFSIIRNLFINHGDRSPLNNGVANEWEYINNLVHYGGTFGSIKGHPKQKANLIGNAISPNAPFENETFRFINCSTDNCPPSGSSDYTGTQVYYTDNLDFTNVNDLADYNANMQTYLQGAPVAVAASDYTPVSAEAAINLVIANAGAGVGTAQGRDALDQIYISDYLNGTGRFSKSLGGVPPDLTTGGTGLYLDDDGDGLSNEYEIKNGASPGNWFVSPFTRPVTAQLVSGVTIDQTAVTSGIRYTHMDIFLAELAGDWTGGTPGGGGTNTTSPDSGKNATSAMLIAH